LDFFGSVICLCSRALLLFVILLMNQPSVLAADTNTPESLPANIPLPDSLKLSGLPPFFGSHPWPPIDPFNPDAAVATNLPAGDRFYKIFAPGAHPPTDPLGSLVITFPTGNSFLPKIVSVTGNYPGTSDTASNRSYSVNVVQDDSGKVTFLGTVDGLLGKTGSPQISGVGFIRTIQGKPVLRLRGSLAGTLDANPLRGSGTFTALPALAGFGASGFGLSVTGSYAGKLSDAALSGRKALLQIPVLADSATNIHDGWTLNLDIHSKTVGKAQRTFVTAQLALPSGDTIAFPERPARYTKTGYTLSFVGGTNITANPPVRNHRASIGILAMSVSQGTNGLVATSGTIRYRFLGQAGTANLVDFMPTSAKPVTKTYSSPK
jgi:hypothetical protein